MWFSINRLANCFDVPPWPTGLRRLCFDPEIVGSRSGGAGTQFFFFSCTFAVFYLLHMVCFVEKSTVGYFFSTKHTMCKSCKWSLG